MARRDRPRARAVAPSQKESTKSIKKGLAVLAAMVLSGAAFAGASVVPDEGGRFTGCVHTQTGALRVIDASGSDQCKPQEYQITWNEQGRQGDRGPVGPVGPQGGQGQEGPAGRAGPAGTVAALDDLTGVPCLGGQPGAGTVRVTYGRPAGDSRPIGLSCVPTDQTLLTVEPNRGGAVSGGGVECGAICSMRFAPGAGVTLTAVPDATHRFAGWTGDCSGTGACDLAMDVDRTVGANFVELVTLRLEMLNASQGPATVFSHPQAYNFPSPETSCSTWARTVCSFQYDVGTAVTLNAYWSRTSTFGGWSGDECRTSTGADAGGPWAICSLVMSGDKQVTATFRDGASPPPTASCGDLASFDPRTTLAYDDYPISGETATNQYRSYLRRDFVPAVQSAATLVEQMVTDSATGHGAPIGLGDMSECDGSIPGTSTGEPGHPAGTHTGGLDIDVAYYQTGTADNHIRPVCESRTDRGEQNHCISPPDRLDTRRTALFLEALTSSAPVRVIGVDGQIGPLLEAELQRLCTEGATACTPVPLAYETTEQGQGWFYFHHHHMHISFRQPSR